MPCSIPEPGLDPKIDFSRTWYQHPNNRPLPGLSSFDVSTAPQLFTGFWKSLVNNGSRDTRNIKSPAKDSHFGSALKHRICHYGGMTVSKLYSHPFASQSHRMVFSLCRAQDVCRTLALSGKFLVSRTELILTFA